MDNHDLPQPRKARKSKRLKDSPEVRIANITEYWHVLGQHPTLGDDWRELRECVIDTLVGDLTIPEGSRWERDTPLHLRVPDQAALRTAIPPERRADCARELQRLEGDLAGSTAVMYLQAAAVYITTRYPNLHACRLHLDNDVLRRAFRAVLAADRWEAGLEWLIRRMRETNDPRKPTGAQLREAAGLWEIAPAPSPGRRRLLPGIEPRVPALHLRQIDTEAPDGDDPQGTVIAIYVTRCTSERACLAAARTQWNRYAPPIGKRERGASIDLAGRMANYRTWWAWYSAQPEHLGGDYRLRTAVGRGEVGDTHDWATSPSGFQYDVDAAWTWLQRVETLPDAHAFIRDFSPMPGGAGGN